MIDDIPSGKLCTDIVHRDPHLDHQYHHVIGKICDLVDCFPPVLRLGGNDDLCRFLSHLLDDLIQAFFKKVSCIRSGRQIPFTAL